MKARISYPIVVMGPIHNGAQEHPALINRVWSDQDTVDGPVAVDATMFPSGGGDAQFQSSVMLYDTRDLAIEAGKGRRVAYWGGNA